MEAKNYVIGLLRRARFAYVIISIFIILNTLSMIVSHAHPIWIGLSIAGLFLWAKYIRDINHDINLWKSIEDVKPKPAKDDCTV